MRSMSSKEKARDQRTRRRPIGSTLRDGALIVAGSLIYAVGIDCFEVPNGLAAGGLTGLATIIYAIGKQAGLLLPVGIQTILMNVLLLVYVELRTHDRTYVTLSIAGILVSGFLTDAVAPFLPNLGAGDLLLSAIWGGVLVGGGIGLVFLTGGNTGGTDIICQMIAKKTGASVGTVALAVDGLIILASVPVFSLKNALYAVIALVVSSRVIDMVVDGPRTERVAYIISDHHEAIANAIMYDLGRGCTELQARGVWSGNERPVLFCVLGRSQTVVLKEAVARLDPDAIVIITGLRPAELTVETPHRSRRSRFHTFALFP